MLDNVPDEIKLKALLEVVRNAILHSKNTEIFRLEQILEEEREGVFEIPIVLTREEVKKKIQEEVKAKLSNRPIGVELKEEHFEVSRGSRVPRKTTIEWVEPKLNVPTLDSLNVQNKRPVKRVIAKKPIVPQKILSQPRRINNNFQRRILRIPEHKLPPRLSHIKPSPTSEEIDLGNLNIFVKDNNVRTMEIAGEGERVFVTGTMGRMPTGITMTKDEINEVINKFSIVSKIPISNGIFKVAYGNLLLTAMISETVSPRLTLEKLSNNSMNPPMPRR